MQCINRISCCQLPCWIKRHLFAPLQLYEEVGSEPNVPFFLNFFSSTFKMFELYIKIQKKFLFDCRIHILLQFSSIRLDHSDSTQNCSIHRIIQALTTVADWINHFLSLFTASVAARNRIFSVAIDQTEFTLNCLLYTVVKYFAN